jgi:hypothetical protein
MKCVMDLLKIDDDNIIQSALEALVEIIKVNFQHMHIYIDSFVELTEYLLQKKNLDPRAVAYSIEIWNTLFEEDIFQEKSLR